MWAFGLFVCNFIYYSTTVALAPILLYLVSKCGGETIIKEESIPSSAPVYQRELQVNTCPLEALEASHTLIKDRYVTLTLPLT